MAEEKDAAKKKEAAVKTPSAKKRDIQSEQRRKRNQSYRSSVATAVRSFEASLAKKETPEALKTKLSTIYTLMDKGVKKGVYKSNKAARTKSRLTAKVKNKIIIYYFRFIFNNLLLGTAPNLEIYNSLNS